PAPGGVRRIVWGRCCPLVGDAHRQSPERDGCCPDRVRPRTPVGGCCRVQRGFIALESWKQPRGPAPGEDIEVMQFRVHREQLNQKPAQRVGGDLDAGEGEDRVVELDAGTACLVSSRLDRLALAWSAHGERVGKRRYRGPKSIL